MNESAPAGDRKSGKFGHIPVLPHRVADLLRPGTETLGDDTVVVDGTLDVGGHTEYLLGQFPKLCVVGLDRDSNALRGAGERLAHFDNRFVASRVRFDSLAEVLSGGTLAATGDSGAGSILTRAAGKGTAGALFGLGVSSMQLGQVNCGSAYRVDAPLDMRMNVSQETTAAGMPSAYSHDDIARILSAYGDERFAGKTASAILHEREKEPFTNSDRLVELPYETIPAASRCKGGRPAKRTFQALRAEVSRKLGALENVLPQIYDALAVDKRAVFMGYQSLEGRITKEDFVKRVKSTISPGLPIELPGHEPHFALITEGAEKTSVSRIEDNPRAAPMGVRYIERVRAD